MKKRDPQPARSPSLIPLWFVVVFVSGAIAANWIRPRPTPPASAPPRALTAAIDDLTQRLVDLERRMQALASAPRPVPAAPSTPGPAAPAPAAPAVASDDAAPAEPVAARVESVESGPGGAAVAAATAARLDSTIDDEPIDEAWAAEQERQIEADTAGGALGAGYLVDAQCRASLCRIQLEHPSPAELDHVMITLMSKPAFAGRRVFIQQSTDGSGNGQMTLYVARAGQRLATDAVAQSE